MYVGCIPEIQPPDNVVCISSRGYVYSGCSHILTQDKIGGATFDGGR